MNARDAQREFERLGSELDSAVEQLVTAPTAVDEWTATLRAAVETVERTRTAVPAMAASEGFRALIARMQQRTRQVEVLLESAALFYCGAVAVGGAPQTPGGYTYEGIAEQFAASGRMQLEA
jgi:hypothetical protein